MSCRLLLALLLAVPTAAAGTQWQAAVEIAAGRGERGPWQQNDSRYDYVDDPAVAIDDRGRTAVAWVDQGRKDVFVNGVNVSRSPATFSWLPRLALAGDQVFVLWQEIIFSGGSHGGDILFARSADRGKTFSEPLNLSDSVAGDGKGRITRDLWHNGSLDLAVAADGSVYAAWTEYEGPLWFTRSRDGGRTFSRLIKVNEKQGEPARGPSLAVAGQTVHLAWTDGDIRVATSTDGGASFGAPLRVTRSSGYTDAPKIALDPSGALHLAYEEDSRILYARSTDGARSFGQARPLSEAGAGFPALGVDGARGVYVTYERFPRGQHRPRGLGFTRSRDGGVNFSPPETIPGSADPGGAPNGSFQGLLMQKLAVNRHGALAVVNSSLEDGARSRVWLLRGRN
jgi:hypothetical protein